MTLCNHCGRLRPAAQMCGPRWPNVCKLCENERQRRKYALDAEFREMMKRKAREYHHAKT